jgi:hypothetical protein
MPRGSKPGERRGGRQRGTPNKKTALVNVVFGVAAANPDISPLEFLLGIMRAPNVSAELRIKAAQIAAPYVHSKLGTAVPEDLGAASKPDDKIPWDTDNIEDHPLYPSLMAWKQALRRSKGEAEE